MGALTVPVLSGLLGMAFVAFLVWDVLRKSPGNEAMVRISRSVQEGARAFLKREYSYVSILVLIVAVLIALTPILTGNPDNLKQEKWQ